MAARERRSGPGGWAASPVPEEVGVRALRKKLRLLLCEKLGWHKPGVIRGNINDPLNFQMYSDCRYCGYSGMIDSQGNLF